MDFQWVARHLLEPHILVACRVGIGRSTSIIIANLGCTHGLSFKEAQDVVTQKHPGTTPSPHLASFSEQLKTKIPVLPLTDTP